MSVVPIRPLRPGSVRPIPPVAYVTLSRELREALTALDARVGDLKRIFSGSATTQAQLARLDALIADAMDELHRMRRLRR